MRLYRIIALNLTVQVLFSPFTYVHLHMPKYSTMHAKLTDN